MRASTASAVSDKRSQLIRYLWGDESFPRDKLPSAVRTDAPNPLGAGDAVERVDELTIEVPPSYRTIAYHFVAKRENGTAVVVHEGHDCPLRSGLIDKLLDEGFSVLRVYMPHLRPGDCSPERSLRHDRMFEELDDQPGSPMKYFLEPVAVGLNHLRAQRARRGGPRYRRFHMLGLSGGGWTTTVYAAIDPRIQISFPVAGSIPLYLRRCRSEEQHCTDGHLGDAEQGIASFYEIAGYLDLYVLGAAGRGRGQLQVLNRRDTCCFGEAQHDRQRTGVAWETAVRRYERRVQAALRKLGTGWYRLEIDETAHGHELTAHTIERLIVPALSSPGYRPPPAPVERIGPCLKPPCTPSPAR